MPAITPYKVFDASLQAKQLLSPHLMRITLAGPMIADMATSAPDQRIKLFFPAPDGSPAALPHAADWYAQYRAMNVSERPAMRTYTIRHLRACECEVDVDFVLHGDTGPASRWASHAQPGDRVQIVAPDRHYPGEPGGFEWKPPQALKHLLLVADATALPAALGILDQLAQASQPPVTQAFIEIESAQDRLETPHWPGLKVHWLVRDQRSPAPAAGTLMVEAVRQVTLPTISGGAQEVELAEVDVDEEILWEVFESANDGFYGWIAGETAAVMSLRKYLIKERAIPREALNLMGYWRYNKSGD